MSIEDLVTSVSRTMDDLRAVLDEETDALRAMHVAGIEGFSVRKTGLEQVFQRKLRTLGSRKAELEDLNEDDMQALRNGEAALKRSAMANQKAIESAQSVSQRIIDTVVDCARDASAKPAAYGKAAQPNERDQAYVPVAINQTF